MGEEIGHVETFFILMKDYIETHSILNIILMFWNFIGSMLILLLGYIMFNEVESKRTTLSVFSLWGTKVALVLVMIGALFQSMKIEVPSLRTGLFFTGALIYLIIIVVSYKQNKHTP